jgi:GT2 family glycosyltransferase
VNNSPGDSTEEIARSFPDVLYCEPGENVGFGRAVNLGASEVREQFVVVANPDAHPSEGTVSALIDFLSAHPEAAVAAPRMSYPDGSIYRNSKRPMSLIRMAFEAVGWPQVLQVSRTTREHEAPHRTECVIAAFMLCRVSAGVDIGWFDESIFLFGEDQDICRRFTEAGWEIWYAAAGNVLHESGHSWRQRPKAAQQNLDLARTRELAADQGELAASIYRLTRRLRRAGVS